MWVCLLNDDFNTASEAWHDLAMNCKDIESRGTDKKAAKHGVLDKAITIYVNISGDG